MSFPEPAFTRAQSRRDGAALLARIDEAAAHADLRRYEGCQAALQQPGTLAIRYAELAGELAALRERARALADRTPNERDDADDYRALESALEVVETLTVTVVTFHHAHTELDRAFFARIEWPAGTEGERTFHSQRRDGAFCDLNRRFVELERAFWSQPYRAADADLPLLDVLAARSAALRADCCAFLDAAPAPGLVAEIRRHLDCAGQIARETPYFRHHMLRTWLAEAGEALRGWDETMQRPFSFKAVRDAYVRLETLQAYPEAVGLAHAASFVDDPRRVVGAWRDSIVEPLLRNDLLYLYREAAGGEKWTTAAFVHGLALASQRRVPVDMELRTTGTGR
jgi:hypothetical protein